MPGTLFVVATPIGNLEDISARALRVLREVDLIAAEDTRRTARLLARYAIDTPTTSFHQHNESAKERSLLERLRQGQSVALVSDAGTPTISDPGQHLVRSAREHGIRVEPIPGPNAALAALMASGVPAQRFTFLGFPPIKAKDRIEWLETLRAAKHPVVFYEAPHRIRETLAAIRHVVGDCEASLGREITKQHEEFVNGPISALIEGLGDPKGEFTVVLEVGQKTESATAGEILSPDAMLAHFGRLMEYGGLSRRNAVAKMARELGMRPNDVYRALEEARKSVT
jgi:16S rRNA (cytidine1402-2'-O)-methyltransferase